MEQAAPRTVPRRRRTLRVIAALAFLAALPLALVFFALVASLPTLDGSHSSKDLASEVTVERDDLGVATIAGGDRVAVAYGLGYAHAQDRFFQMDLSRRLAAGELSALVGPAALDQDRRARLFGFRAVAREVLVRESPAERAIAEGYARGVNAGLASLASRPWEYWVLRSAPAPWSAEDSILVALTMWWDLQSTDLPREMTRRQLLQALAPDASSCAEDEVCRFLYPRGTEWDAPVEGTARAAAQDVALQMPAPIPAPDRLEARSRERTASLPLWTASILRRETSPASWTDAAWEAAGTGRIAGSNNWALAGSRSASGAAIVANDMHLGLRVPPVWYRARLVVRGDGAGARDLAGLTLPGTPLLVAGSNGSVAWGLTNSAGNWVDVRLRDCDPARVRVVASQERVDVNGARAVPVNIERVPLGVVLAHHPRDAGRCWVASWLAMNPEATNLRLLAMEEARTVDDALRLAPHIGVPGVNVVVGDRDGRIAWTVFGRIPAQEDRGAAPGLHATTQWLDAPEFPAIVDPPDGLLWTANARAAEGVDERRIGGEEWATGANYPLGARAAQIRDGLRALPAKATPADMLRVQLDDRARFLERWQRLLVATLDAAAVADRPDRAQLRRTVENWQGRASPDSTGYRLVRSFRSHAAAATWVTLVAAAGLRGEPGMPPMQFEGPLWRLVTQKPSHLLATPYRSWREFLLAQADAVIADARDECGAIDPCPWGARHAVEVRHPLSGALGPFARLLDMPTLELPGDHDMPRVQDGAFGASERFAVSPGHEAEGYVQLPGGQSGHPLSPYYRAGFADWAAGRPSPFLPGPARHRLVLEPAGG